MVTFVLKMEEIHSPEALLTTTKRTIIKVLMPQKPQLRNLKRVYQTLICN
jgi:hypothetical protein